MKKDSQIKEFIPKNFVWLLVIGFFLGFFAGQFWIKRHTWVSVYYPNRDNLDYYQLSPPLYSLDECRKWVNSRIKGNTNYDYECGRYCRFELEYGEIVGPMICGETVR